MINNNGAMKKTSMVAMRLEMYKNPQPTMKKMVFGYDKGVNL